MSHLLCLLRGHQRTPVVFATNRYYCRRCGIDLDPDPTSNLESPRASASAVNQTDRQEARERPRRAAARMTQRTGNIR